MIKYEDLPVELKKLYLYLRILILKEYKERKKWRVLQHLYRTEEVKTDNGKIGYIKSENLTDFKTERSEEKEEQKTISIAWEYFSKVAKAPKNDITTKYDGIKTNADPRKWEMASKMLYATREPEMIRSLVGEGITKDFVSFCNINIVSIQDVINGNYNSRDYEGDVAKKYATALALSQVDDANVGVVRDFVKKMGLEVLTLFDEFWSKGNPERAEKLEDIRSMGLTWRKK